MISMARGLGAPDKVPAGKVAKRASTGSASLASFPVTVETICITCE